MKTSRVFLETAESWEGTGFPTTGDTKLNFREGSWGVTTGLISLIWPSCSFEVSFSIEVVIASGDGGESLPSSSGDVSFEDAVPLGGGRGGNVVGWGGEEYE